MVRGRALPARGEAAEPAFPTLADVYATLTDAGQRLLHVRLICGRAAPVQKAALASPIHDRPRYGSATRLWVITSFQERDYLAPMASRVRRGAQGRLLDMHRVDVRMTPYRWRPGGGALTGFNDVVTWPRWRLQPQHRRRQCV